MGSPQRNTFRTFDIHKIGLIMTTFNQFKQKLRDEIKEKEFLDEIILKEYEELREELGDLEKHSKYKPRIALFDSSKLCPFCKAKLTILLASRTLGSFNWFERFIYRCSCGYKFPDVRKV